MLSPFCCGLVVLGVCGLAARADEVRCDGLPVTNREYIPQSSDVLQPRHLTLTRPFAGSGKLEVNVCAANVRVLTRPDAKELKLTIEMDSQSGGHEAADYIQTFSVQQEHGEIYLKFPGEAHATVTLAVPMSSSSSSQFDVARGDLEFDAIGGSGSREINVGMGHMKLLVDGDKSYSKMQVNIGMGSLHDHRPGGHDGHLVVSKAYSGSGSGSLEINVGMGSLDIRQE